jgi:hypothetical protein
MILFTAKSCNQLMVYEHGLKVCTGWMTDYGQYCLVYCDKSVTLTNEDNYNQWHVCGASGKRIPSSSLPKCDSKYS